MKITLYFYYTNLCNTALPSPKTKNMRYSLRSRIRVSAQAKIAWAAFFNPSARVDASTTRKYGSMDLSLAISRNLAERMSGRIWAESEPGKGPAFYFIIQVDTSQNHSLAEPAKEPIMPYSGDADGQKSCAYYWPSTTQLTRR